MDELRKNIENEEMASAQADATPMGQELDFNASGQSGSAEYVEDDIKTLDWREHIRLRPGMYIGKLGDGTYNEDGIYVLLKEVRDNPINE